MKSIKCVIVGDEAVGKTSLLVSYVMKHLIKDHIPTIVDKYISDCTIDGINVCLYLWDTSGDTEFDKLRPLSYNYTDIFLVCFSTVSSASFDNIKSKWIPEITNLSPGTPYILVGTKTDLRKESDSNCISHNQGSIMAQEISAIGYVECSHTDQNSIDKVFTQTIRTILSSTNNSTYSWVTGYCNLL